MDRTVGTCSVCSGRVTLPEAWYATIPPVPTCQSCGATKAQPNGPVIKMEPKREPLPDLEEVLGTLLFAGRRRKSK